MWGVCRFIPDSDEIGVKMFFINHPDSFRNVSYDSFIHKGKIVNLSTSYVRITHEGENVYSITVVSMPNSEGSLDLGLATKAARKMLDFISHVENKSYDLRLEFPTNGEVVFGTGSMVVFDVINKETQND